MMSILKLDDEGPITSSEKAVLIRQTERVVHVWNKGALYSTAAFFVSCASVWPFFTGYPLHKYWAGLGRYLLLLSMVLLLPWVICVVIAGQMQIELRKLRNKPTVENPSK
jgi:hypothetical protein